MENLFISGHTACAGCGQAIGARIVANVAGKNSIFTNATGCLEVFSTGFPHTSWKMPWIHSLFENSASVASGIEAALKSLGEKDKINVVAQGGDGGTADIGFQALSGMLERGHDILYVMYDNEAYMNCLSRDSLIMTESGLKPILDIKVGEKIAAIDLKTHQLVYKKCIGVFDNGIQDIYELKTSHNSIKATANHPFLVLKRRGRGKENELIWKRLDEIKIGDEVVALKKIKDEKSYQFSFQKVEKGDFKVNKLNPINIPSKSSPEIMQYLGIYLGDGWIREEKGEIGFALPKYTEERKIFLKLHKKIFKSKFREDNMYIYINSVNLARFISSLGFNNGAKSKTIPSWIFTLPQKEKEAFIEGLMLSDGYKYNGSWRYVSASYDLLKRLRLLAKITGFNPGKIHWQKVRKGKKIGGRKLLRDTAFGYICMSRRKRANFKKWPSQTRYRNFFSNNEFFDIEKVKEVNYVIKQATLDLRVEDEHNFVADGIIVHNTGIQRSGMTPTFASTTTSPPGKLSFGNPRPKKNMVEICAVHGIPYSATASVGFPKDVEKKVKKALSIKGPKFIHLFVPCPLGWGSLPENTYKVGRLVVETGILPLVEFENGKLANVRKFKELKPIEEFLKLQKRFKHLLKDDTETKKHLEFLKKIVEKNIEKYGLISK
jgi:pyruvate/2-oxoacid:ferredoxin oxidoreductase beta subunit